MLENANSIYEGYFHYNKFEGTGSLSSKSNSEKYIGEFAYGMFHDKGIYSWGDGREFKGYFVENNITGLGVLTYKNGEFYEGELRLG